MKAVLGRRSLFAVLTALAMALMVAVVAASAAKAQAEKIDKIDICHAVPVAGPNVNHYNLISVDNNATFGGQRGHRRT